MLCSQKVTFYGGNAGQNRLAAAASGGSGGGGSGAGGGGGGGGSGVLTPIKPAQTSLVQPHASPYFSAPALTTSSVGSGPPSAGKPPRFTQSTLVPVRAGSTAELSIAIDDSVSDEIDENYDSKSSNRRPPQNPYDPYSAASTHIARVLSLCVHVVLTGDFCWAVQ